MRIRSIKPEFWSSDDIAELPWDARLLFIGLWSYVADSGVGRDNDKLIAADLFPLEDDPLETLATVSRGLATLSDAGLITRYRVGTKRFLHITNWSAHQKIDKPTRSPFPPPTCEDAEFGEPSRGSRESSPPGTRDLGNKGSREQGSQGVLSDESDEVEADRFEEFWDTYDKKDGRKRCETAYRAALKKPGVTPDLLIASAFAYVNWQISEGKHPQYTKNPLTWLHGEHWRDERPARPAPQSNAQGWLRLANEIAEDEGSVSPFRAIGGSS
jgi:hypothetical protein